MVKYKKIIIALFIFSTCFILAVIVFMKNYNNPEKVVRDYIKYQNEHNLDELNKITTSKWEYYLVENIDYMNLIDMKLVTDKSEYEKYLHSGGGRRFKNLTIDDVRIYKIKYYVKYKDEKKSVTGNGEQTKNIILIKEKGSGLWKRSDGGE